ncbi:hypothetical protein [Nitrospira sp. Kam-Ns4a]
MATPNRSNERIGIRVTREERQVLERLAGHRGLSAAVRDMLARAVRQLEEDKVREELRRDLAKVEAVAEGLAGKLDQLCAAIGSLAERMDISIRLAEAAAKHAYVAAARIHALGLAQLRHMTDIREAYRRESEEITQHSEEFVKRIRAS